MVSVLRLAVTTTFLLKTFAVADCSASGLRDFVQRSGKVMNFSTKKTQIKYIDCVCAKITYSIWLFPSICQNCSDRTTENELAAIETDRVRVWKMSFFSLTIFGFLYSVGVSNQQHNTITYRNLRATWWWKKSWIRQNECTHTRNISYAYHQIHLHLSLASCFTHTFDPARRHLHYCSSLIRNTRVENCPIGPTTQNVCLHQSPYRLT